MKFEILKSDKLDKILYYYTSEHSFFYDTTTNADIFFLISYLGFGSDDMILKSISGLSFKERWREYILKEPDGENGKLRVIGKYESGKSYRLNRDSIWASYFDKVTGWFCAGNPQTGSRDNTARYSKMRILYLMK